MTHINVEDVVGPCALTLFSSIQMAAFAKRVGLARSKYKIQPPAIDGDDNFVRIYRAHQNSVEFYPLFLGGLWTSSLMLHQGIFMSTFSKYFKLNTKD
ncbi:microsomal glutathione S-transferase 2-like [Rhopilema esculentum]|uniref:microsomal glutathione S-transferase 2-like n=1 Tax=Rhopilema esculentum TaxID=499914 RepID=UPI0031DF9227